MLTPKHASGSLRSWTARGQQIPACRAGTLPSEPAIAFGTGSHRTVRKKRERPSMYASRYRNMPFYFGYGGRAASAYGGYGRVYDWPQWYLSNLRKELIA
jgi:hypothetical protein